MSGCLFTCTSSKDESTVIPCSTQEIGMFCEDLVLKNKDFHWLIIFDSSTEFVLRE